MRILIAPDKFKGSLSSAEAAAAIERGVRAVFPDPEVRSLPVADGGEGTSELLSDALGGERVTCRTVDPLGREIDACYTRVPERKLAVVDMSAAAGMWRLSKLERDPMQVSTFGVGKMMAHAIESGAETVWVGLGGSATNDAGCGMAAALGWKFEDENGNELPPNPAGLSQLARAVPASVPLSAFIVSLSDVANPLLGPTGCSHVFGPQKGASSHQVEDLDAILGHVRDLVGDVAPAAFEDVPGDGAAGGIGWGLRVFCGAEMRNGFEAVAEAVGIEEEIRNADLVITGEGKLDEQSLSGKGPVGLARLARKHGIPAIALVGALDHSERLFELFSGVVPLAHGPMTEEESHENAARHLERAAFRAAHLLRAGQTLKNS